jgi:uncharacterized protein (DUF433 family)
MEKSLGGIMDSEKRWSPKAYKQYKWIVKDPELLGGKLALRGTRLSVSHILACLAEDMTHAEIEESYGPVPHEAIVEVLALAAQILENPDVAA